MQALRDFRIGEGGLLRRCEKAVGLTSLGRQIVAAVSLTWLPVVGLSLVNERLTGVREPLVHAPALHVRLLVTVPVLLTLDHVFPRVCRSALEQLAAQSFLPDRAQEPFDRLLRRATRLADSLLPELLLALLAFGLAASAVAGLLPGSSIRPRPGLTVAHVWYTLADWPVLQFLLWRSLWRWAIWVVILRGVARLDLEPVAAHPDRRGGLSFLRRHLAPWCQRRTSSSHKKIGGTGELRQCRMQVAVFAWIERPRARGQAQVRARLSSKRRRTASREDLGAPSLSV